MADNLVVQSGTLGTLPVGTTIGTRTVTYSGDAGAMIAPVGLVAFSGSDDAKTATDLPGTAANGLLVDVSRHLDVTSGPTAITTQNLVPAGAATANSAVAITLSGASTLAVQVTGTYTGALSAQVTVDGTNWVTIGGTPFVNVNTGAYSATIASAAVGVFQIEATGVAQLRITALAAVTGTATVSIRASMSAGLVTIDNALPAGTAIIGALSANQSTNIAQMNGVATTMGVGVSGTGVQRVAIATDGQGQIADNAAFTDGTTRIDMAGYIFDETAGTALTENDAAAARINANRAQVFTLEDSTTRGQRAAVNASTGLNTTLTPHTAGGLTMSKVISAASTNATSTKASAGQVYSVQLFNTNAAVRYFKLYNKASAPTVGTDVPVKVLAIPGNTAGAGLVHSWEQGIAFATGIAWALTTGVADADTGAVAANECTVNIDYK